jgi:hypothetical protein
MKKGERIAYGNCYDVNGDWETLIITVKIKGSTTVRSFAPNVIEYIKREPIKIQIRGHKETLEPGDPGYDNAMLQAIEYFKEEGLM